MSFTSHRHRSRALLPVAPLTTTEHYFAATVLVSARRHSQNPGLPGGLIHGVQYGAP